MVERILIVDDDDNVCELVRIALEAEGLNVDAALDGKEGLKKALSGNYAVILLDIMLPEIDGWEICRQIRSSSLKNIPIIMLTARGEEVDRVLGLELGSDDYVTKPFSPRELAARVKALIRRADQYSTAQQELGCCDITIDPRNNTAKIKDKVLELTPKETALLNLLCRQLGKPVTREEMLQEVWGFDNPGVITRTVDEHIKRLRAKISRLDSHNIRIKTVWGIGYKLEVMEID